MMKLLNYPALLCSLIMISAVAPSDVDQAVDTLEKMNTQLVDAKSYEVQVQVKLLSSERDAALMEFNGHSARSGTSRFSYMNGQKVILNRELYLSHDERSKVIVVGPSKDMTPAFGMTGPEELLASYKKNMSSLSKNMSVNDLSDASMTITFTHEEDEAYAHTRIHIDRKRLVPTKVIYYLHDADATQGYDRIEMSYSTFTVDTPVDRLRFSTKNFVSIAADGSYKLTKRYADHELIDLRTE